MAILIMICLPLLCDVWLARVICLRSSYSQIDPVFILILPLTSCANSVKSLPSLCLLPRWEVEALRPIVSQVLLRRSWWFTSDQGWPRGRRGNSASLTTLAKISPFPRFRKSFPFLGLYMNKQRKIHPKFFIMHSTKHDSKDMNQEKFKIILVNTWKISPSHYPDSQYMLM